uniref:DNA-directed RNA polymerase subunit beta n=1 Tax=Prasinococcus sp. CCMP1194 TaxID=110672 RepID=A0A088CI71_9VIRI|nr:beta subunit of RNA polymerase [Prasinococcus sp. CCMP1194]
MNQKISPIILPDLIEIQRTSFFWFLHQGIFEELTKFSTLYDSKSLSSINFQSKTLKYLPPSLQIVEAAEQGKTYSIGVTVKMFLKNGSFLKIRPRRYQLGEIPLMTGRGTFLIKGLSRVYINQIVRSPGVYFDLKLDHKGRRKYSTTFLSKRGKWLKFETEIRKRKKRQTKEEQEQERQMWQMSPKKRLNYQIKLLKLQKEQKRGRKRLNTEEEKRKFEREKEKEKHRYEKRIMVRIDKYEKTNILFFLKGFGCTDQFLAKHIQSFFFLSPTYRLEPIITEKASYCLRRIHRDLDPWNYNTLFKNFSFLPPEDYIIHNFMNPLKYDLSQAGRYKINKKLDQKEFENLHTLTMFDLVKALNYMIQLEFGQGEIDDIDHLKNRRIKSIGEVYQDQIYTYLKDLSDQVKLMDFNDQFQYKELDQINDINLKFIKAESSKKIFSPKTVQNFSNYVIYLSLQLLTKLNFLLSLFSFSLFLFFNKTLTICEDYLKSQKFLSSQKLIKINSKASLQNLTHEIQQKGNLGPLFSARSRVKMTKNFQNLFSSSPLSQLLDTTNPLAEVTHKRRISCLGPGGLSRERASFAVRDIHPSFYGRICPIETPEGQNAGLISSLALYAKANALGFIETPFFSIQNGLTSFLPKFLTASNEINIKIASPDISPGIYSLLNTQDHKKSALISKTILNKKRDLFSLHPTSKLVSKQNNLLFPARYKEDFTSALWREIDFIGVSPIQPLSIATALIPFLEHDDANRALMGSNMQRQAVPLLELERPIVGTGLEEQVVLDSGAVEVCRESGIVTYASSSTVSIFSPNSGKTRYYKGGNLFQAGRGTFLQKNEWVEKGTPILDNKGSCWGELSLGKNICVAYLPWEGYNFEDALIISQRLVSEDIYTSVHINTYQVSLGQKVSNFGTSIQETVRDIPNIPESSLLNLDENGIISIGSWVEEGDILVGRRISQYEEETSPEIRLLYAIFNDVERKYKYLPYRAPQGVRGRVVGIKRGKNLGNGKISLENGRNLDYKNTNFTKNKKANLSLTEEETIQIFIVQKRKIQVGDKMAGRHGNKGIISKILLQYDMPFLQDGTCTDLLLNPLGIPSRMNVGQVYESLLGFAGFYLSQRYKIQAFDEMFGRHTSRKFVYSKLYEARKKTGYKWIFKKTSPGKSRLFDGRTGEAFDQPIMVGRPYMLKLSHLVDHKIHARSVGPYALVTKQPLGGRAKKGGQRFGEMEVWALEGFGAAYTLQELLTIKSDDIEGRNEAYLSFIRDRNFPLPKVPESFNVLICELRALCIDLKIFS